MRLLPLLLILLPLAEIATFIAVRSRIGVLWTIALVMATTVAGALLLRIQGIGTVMRAQAAMERGDAPARELVDGVMIAVAGLLLILPGFITDLVGLLLFLPPVRAIAWKMLRGRITIVTAPFSRGGRVVDLDTDEFTRHEPRGGEPRFPRIGPDRGTD